MDETTELLHRAAAGDRLSLAAFIRATQADVWRFCAHLVDRDAADDLTQEVYVRAMRSMHRFRGDARAKTWLLAVARNVAADEIRRRQRWRRRQETTDQVPEVAEAPEVDALGVQQLIAELASDRREVFVLTQVLGWSYADTAATLDVPIGTVRSRVARAREELRTLVDAAEDVTDDDGHEDGPRAARR